MRLTDFSQLKKGAIRTEPMKPAAAPPKEPVRKTELDLDAAQLFAEFIGAAPKSPKRGRAVAKKSVEKSVEQKSVGDDALKTAEARIAELTAALKESEVRHAKQERDLAGACEARLAAEQEVARLKGDNARLQDEVRRNKERLVETAPVEVPPAHERPLEGLLKYEGAFAEVFDGEVREQMLAALGEAQVAARQGGRERRARILESVLAENPPSGELERRRGELKQILKNAGGFTDAGTLAALERLGIRTISGHKHWKLQYADIRLPMAKTPSDYRSAQNCATDMANRFF